MKTEDKQVKKNQWNQKSLLETNNKWINLSSDQHNIEKKKPPTLKIEKAPTTLPKMWMLQWYIGGI